MIVNDSVPSLFGGVSQQAPAVRNPSKVAALVNGYPDVGEGLGRRPPTQYRARLSSSAPDTTALVHWIIQDSTEQYAVYITTTGINVWRLSDGVAMTVSAPGGYGYFSGATVARRDLTAFTVADYTFIVNRTRVPQLAAGTVGGTLTGTVQTFGALPASPAANSVYRIAGDATNQFDDYFVRRDGVNNVWVETRAPGSDQFALDAATLPHRLVKTGPTTFTFEPITWQERLVGSAASAPAPSFVGSFPISDLFFYSNRLGFVAGETVFLSRAGNPFALFIETSAAELDSDPIDVTADSSSQSTVKLLNAATYNSSLVVMAENGEQFRLVHGDIVSPKSAKLPSITKFESAADAKPVGLGADLYFAVSRGAFDGLRNYFVDSDTATNDAEDVTAEVPRYVPTGTFRLAGSSTHNCVALLTTGEPNAMYVYKFLWAERKLVQSAWMRWTRLPGMTIMGCEFIGSDIWLVTAQTGAGQGIFLERMDFRPGFTDTQDAGGTPFLMWLDRKVALSGSFSSVTGNTTWTLPYNPLGPIKGVMSAAGWGTRRAAAIPAPTVAGATVTLAGDWSTAQVTFGEVYETRAALSPVYLRDSKGLPRTTGRLQVMRMWLTYDRSGPFRVEVKVPKRASTSTTTVTAKTLGSITDIVGRIPLSSGTTQFPVSAKNDEVSVELVADSYLPVYWQSIEWTGDLVLTGRRVSA